MTEFNSPDFNVGTQKISAKKKLKIILDSFSPKQTFAFLTLFIILLVSALSILSKINKTFLVYLPERGGSLTEGLLGAIIAGQSLLKITVFADTKDEALGFSRAVTKTLVDRGWEYVSGDVVIKPVDDALVSDFPARPNIVFHSGVGFWVGFVLSSLWVVRYKKHKLFKAL
jgi:hypothetical protein